MSGKICFVAALALAAAPCFASPILVSNFSFETLTVDGLPQVCGPGCFYSVSGAIPDWAVTGVGPTGQFQPGPGYFTTLSDGITSAYSNGGTVSQTVGAKVVAGDVYTLLVDIGWAGNAEFMGTADLLINGTTYTATGSQPNQKMWSTYTATYTGLLADVGQDITIELRSSGPQANFDNVRLDAVPEPASFLLFAPALLALGLRFKGTARP